MFIYRGCIMLPGRGNLAMRYSRRDREPVPILETINQQRILYGDATCDFSQYHNLRNLAMSCFGIHTCKSALPMGLPSRRDQENKLIE
jgi:hypothetical protein